MTAIPITRADGWLVTYADRHGLKQWDLRDSLDEAEGAYGNPPKGFISIGISACVDGVPFAALPIPRVQYFRPVYLAAE